MMTFIVIFIIILLAGAVAGLAFYARREAKTRKTNVKAEFVGICKSAVETASQKKERKQKALALLREKGDLSNAEIREALGVSSRTTVRYLDELERAGKVKQIGKTGYAVTYRVQ